MDPTAAHRSAYMLHLLAPAPNDFENLKWPYTASRSTSERDRSHLGLAPPPTLMPGDHSAPQLQARGEILWPALCTGSAIGTLIARSLVDSPILLAGSALGGLLLGPLIHHGANFAIDLYRQGRDDPAATEPASLKGKASALDRRAAATGAVRHVIPLEEETSVQIDRSGAASANALSSHAPDAGRRAPSPTPPTLRPSRRDRLHESAHRLSVGALACGALSFVSGAICLPVASLMVSDPATRIVLCSVPVLVPGLCAGLLAWKAMQTEDRIEGGKGLFATLKAGPPRQVGKSRPGEAQLTGRALLDDVDSQASSERIGGSSSDGSSNDSVLISLSSGDEDESSSGMSASAPVPGKRGQAGEISSSESA